MADTSANRNYSKRVTIGLPVAAAVVLIGLGVSGIVLYPDRHAAGCTVYPADGPPLTSASNGPLDLRLVAAPPPLALGRSMGMQHVTAQYGLASRSPKPVIVNPSRVVHLATIVTDLTRTTDGAQISQDAVSDSPERRLVVASAFYQAGRVSVQLCVDRRAPQESLAGTYHGTVSVIDGRVSRVDLPFTVTAEWPKWPWTLLIVMCAIIGGSWYAWVLHDAGANGAFRDDVKGLSKEFPDWCASMIGMVAIGTGATATAGVYIAQYWNSPDWGSNVSDALTLLGSSFTAFVAVAGGLKIASVASQRRETVVQPPPTLPGQQRRRHDDDVPPDVTPPPVTANVTPNGGSSPRPDPPSPVA
jgi:hypothetical protein